MTGRIPAARLQEMAAQLDRLGRFYRDADGVVWEAVQISFTADPPARYQLRRVIADAPAGPVHVSASELARDYTEID